MAVFNNNNNNNNKSNNSNDNKTRKIYVEQKEWNFHMTVFCPVYTKLK